MMTDLSESQLETLRCKAKGLTNKQVARVMGVPCETVKSRVATIRQKFGAHGDFCAVVLKAERDGLLVGVEV
jgi:DNA-binding NarL/FixJ family response regulator